MCIVLGLHGVMQAGSGSEGADAPPIPAWIPTGVLRHVRQMPRGHMPDVRLVLPSRATYSCGPVRPPVLSTGATALPLKDSAESNTSPRPEMGKLFDDIEVDEDDVLASRKCAKIER